MGVKGYFFTFDALIGITLMISLLVVMPMLYVDVPDKEHLNAYSGDIVKILSSVKINEVDNPYLSYLVNTGRVRDSNLTIMQLLGEYWAAGESGIAEQLVLNLTSGLIPPNYNLAVAVGNDLLSSSNSSKSNNLVSYRSYISGIVEGQDSEGYTSRVSLTGLNSKSSYSFFGGYVGDGMITQKVELPSMTKVNYVYMELDAGNDFDLFINGFYCDNFVVNSSEAMAPDSWYFNSSCFDYLNEDNLVTINFTSPYSNFIAGGYIKVNYESSESNLSFAASEVVKKDWLPGIQGFINLYSSFYAPNNISNITFYLHYLSNYTTYVNVGNSTVYEAEGFGNETSLYLNLTLDYSSLNYKTVPLRIGTRNPNLVPWSGFSDVVLLTERTGSMNGCDVDSFSCLRSDCNSNLQGCQNTRKDVVLDAGKNFLDVILSSYGSKVSLVGYGSQANPVCDFKSFSDDNVSLTERLNNYNNGEWQVCGSSCISCGIEYASSLLMENQHLYGLDRIQVTNNSQYELGEDFVSLTESLDLPALDLNKFVKAKLTIYTKDVDVSEGYRDCVYLNNNYIGQICDSNGGGNDGWHTCVYDITQSVINTSNLLKLTGGNKVSCEGSSGSQDEWEFKDVVLEVWQANSPVLSDSYYLNNYIHVGSGLNYESFIYLPELSQDHPNPVDFSSGFNSTSNTFGPGAGDDGWDWSSGTYNNSFPMVFNGVVNGSLEIYADEDADRSGAYGIQFYIDNYTYSSINGKSVELSFDYQWEGNPEEDFEPSDEVWIKSRFYTPFSGYHYLGSNLDSGHQGADPDLEVYAVNDPDMDFNNTFVQNISSWIEGPGWYYLDFGGKTKIGGDHEWGYFRFDNIALSVYNNTVPVFNLDLNDDVKSARLEFEAKDVDPSLYDCVFINDHYLARIDFQRGFDFSSWQNLTFDVPVSWLNDGSNTFMPTAGDSKGCNRTSSNNTWLLRNVNLTLFSSSDFYVYDRSKSLLVMADSNADTKIGDCSSYNSSSCPLMPGWENPSQETVRKACEAHSLYNISIYAVALTNSDQGLITTLNQSACCDDCSHFFMSNNSDDLVAIYRAIAQNISSTVSYQSINATNISQTILYPDSFIELTYTLFPNVGLLSLPLESASFNNNLSQGIFEIPSGSDILDAKVISYSSDSWTDYLTVNNASEVFKLSDYGDDYSLLGDPYLMHIPLSNIQQGINSVFVSTGTNPQNYTGGSPYSKVLYNIGVNLISNYSGVYTKAEGCAWYIDFEDSSSLSLVLPQNYTGSNVCVYYSNGTLYSPGSAEEDSINIAVEQLLTQLDFDHDSLVDVNIGKNDIGVDTLTLQGVPYMWGPAIAEVRTWQ